jgi:tetratricopeptide (TPR) repeat protein
VIGPGNDARIAAMLEGAKLPAGCHWRGAHVDRSRVVSDYRCTAGEVHLELRHPSDGAGAASSRAAGAFLVVAGAGVPDGLLDAVAAQVKAGQAGFQWTTAAPAQTGPDEAARHAPAQPQQEQPVRGPDAPVPPGWNEGYASAERLLAQGRLEESLVAFERLVPSPPAHPPTGVIVRALAVVGSMSPEPARVARFTADADAHRDDPLLQLVAGVAAHYCGHRHGHTLDEKAASYRLAITYLERARPFYDNEPRLLLYLALSHFRLGEVPVAQDLIERAVPLAGNDPDVFYCRAEIFQRTDLHRSIADVERYLAMTADAHRHGSNDNPEKHHRVEEMLAWLRAVEQGKAAPRELWDPLAPPLRKRRVGLMVLTLVAPLALVAGLLLVRRRRAGRRWAR